MYIHCVGRSSRDINHWFVDHSSEASSLHSGRCHLVFLEPEATIFGREGGTELTLS